MVLPIIGPTAETTNSYWGTTSGGHPVLSYSRTRQRYTQSIPYNLPLQYQMDACTAWMGGTHLGNDYVDAIGNVAIFGPFVGRAQERAYGRTRDSISNHASLGISLAERKQAMGLMANRLTQIASLVKSVKRFDYVNLVRTLKDARADWGSHRSHPWMTANQARVRREKMDQSIEKLNTWRPTSKRWGDRWLEFHFGWSPLIQDVWDVTEVLDSPFPFGRFFGRGTDHQNSGTVLTSYQPHVNYTYQYDGLELRCAIKFGGFVSVFNPNLYLASSLGLTNPALIAWELVPYSFLVDWLSGISSYISSFTDFVGLNFERSWSTFFYTAVETHKYHGINWVFVNPPSGAPGYYEVSLSRSFNYVRKSVRLVRGTTYPYLPAPGATVPSRLSVSRAATAISLLLQRLK